jgi:tetratricopeptide (TPR) repeat protein
MDHLLLQAITMNNEGVELLCDGKVEAAVVRFQQATLVLKAATNVSDGSPSQPQHGPCRRQTTASFGFDKHANGIATLRSDLHYIYNRPLRLPDDIKVTKQVDLERVLLIASTSIIFNMALAWHLHGRISGRTSQLKKARQLYDLVVQVVSDEDQVDGSFLVLECVALNNLAQLCYDLGNYDTSQAYMEDIDDLLMDHNNFLDAYLEAEQADEIRYNIIHAQPPSTAAAA